MSSINYITDQVNLRIIPKKRDGDLRCYCVIMRLMSTEEVNHGVIALAGKKSWFHRNLFSILAMSFVIGLSVGIYLIWCRYPEAIVSLKHYGYIGAFFISLLFNATIILPAGNFLLLSALGAALPLPYLVGIAAGAGAVIGECTGYLAGYSESKTVERSRLYRRVEVWVKRWGSLTIFLLSLFPLIFDIAGLAAGVLRFPFKKFLFWCWLGRTIFYIAVAYAGYFGWEALLRLIARAG
jgi:membrane protein YqaA with SNARE-associated domain